MIFSGVKMIINGVEIENDVPIPEDQEAIRATKWKEVAEKMDVGNSVLVPSSMRYPELQQAMLRLGYKVHCEPQGTTGTRVWRTS